MKDELVQKLKKLGLNEYEARTYLTLLANGQQTAKQISEKSKVPYSRIYDILSNLKQKEWVKEIDKNPKKYQAQHENFTLNKTKEKITNHIKQLKTEIRSYKNANYLKQKPEMLILDGWKNISEIMKEELSRTDKNITTMIGFQPPFLTTFLKKASRKNIDLKLITNKEIELKEAIKNKIEFETKKLPFAPKIWVTWFDWKKIIMIFPTFNKGEIVQEKVRGFYLKEKNFGKWAKEIVESIKLD